MQTPNDPDDEFLTNHPTIRKLLEVQDNDPEKVTEIIVQAVQEKSLTLDDAIMLQEALKRRLEDLQ